MPKTARAMQRIPATRPTPLDLGFLAGASAGVDAAGRRTVDRIADGHDRTVTHRFVRVLVADRHGELHPARTFQKRNQRFTRLHRREEHAGFLHIRIFGMLQNVRRAAQNDVVAFLRHQLMVDRGKHSVEHIPLPLHGLTHLPLKLRRDFGEEAADYAVERMVYLGLIDDRRFAERYAEQLTFVRRCSVRDARARLMQKGISRDIIDEVIAELDVSADDQLDELIRSKYAARLENADEKALKKVIDSLARKGFSYSDIRAAIGRFCDAELYD